METPRFRIRSANNHDLAAVQALVFPIMEEFGLDPAPNGADADLLDIEATYTASGGWLDIVSGNDTVAGCVGMLPLSQRIIELRKMYLHSSLRGRGFGKALLARSLNRASKAGFSHVVLDTATNLKSAIALYKKFGFERDMSDFPRCGKNACDQVWRLALADYTVTEAGAHDLWIEELETS